MYCWGRWGDGEMERLNNEHILYNRILYNSALRKNSQYCRGVNDSYAQAFGRSPLPTVELQRFSN
ncbi:MAG: hypothetical protein F6K23_08115 [Okeania sp. SIO2C9]|uniref:hypothetical protein n=1 Tax=Okeania sp. SIO2C9 TaxID=2607791 RepID=UPI0013C27897|nr:hypothetical protein [Okeania sp. SIO2C9]NEQ73044.1 hypothetical protein [Okeania sp. SIO2C9]